MAVDLDGVRAIVESLPGTEEGFSYGTPGFRVRKKLLARLREDGETLAVRVGFEARQVLLDSNPDAFFFTEHYRNYPMVLVRLAVVEHGHLEVVLEQAWRDLASQRQIRELEEHDD